MPAFDRTPNRGADVARDLTAAGVKLPKAVAAAQEALTAQQTALRALPGVDALRGELVAAVVAEPHGDHHGLASRVAAASALRDAHVAAVERAGRALTAAVDTYSDELTKSIGTAIAGPAIAALEKAATSTSPGDTPGSLTNAQRHDDARVLIEAELAADRLTLAARLRSAVYSGSRIARNPWALWERPDLLPALPESTPQVERFLAGVRAGAGLRWVTLEVADASRRVAEKATADARKAAAATHNARRRPATVGQR